MLNIYKIDWELLHYSEPIEDRELNFLNYFGCDDGTYLISKDVLARQIEYYEKKNREEELPRQLIQFLYEKLKEEGDSFYIGIN